MVLMLFIGLGLMMQMAGTNTLLQSIIADDMRGRVLSLYTMSFMSVAPFGNLLAGFISSRIGAKYTLLGAATILSDLGFQGLEPDSQVHQKYQSHADHQRNQLCIALRDMKFHLGR